MSVINRSPINADYDDDQHVALGGRQHKDDKNYDTLRNYYSIP